MSENTKTIWLISLFTMSAILGVVGILDGEYRNLVFIAVTLEFIGMGFIVKWYPEIAIKAYEQMGDD